ncbi:MAG: hypothetical protein OHK93_000754 [Ramalina farinacea]|uniref:Uncharacterized protein n=1 Tax=Ramalina farinacea TaxID=258253 RepID=A0AA43TYW3_9LECA|nr:hypothetical protein [Ramalina farinacea]
MTTRYNKGKNSATLAMLLNAFEKQPGSQGIGDDSPSDFLSGDTALEMLYSMRGGAPLDYKTGIEIIDELYLFFYYESTAGLDGRPCQGDISVGANVKFQFETEKIIMIPFYFDISNSTSTGIRANGSTWPSQGIAPAAVEDLLDQAYPVTQPKSGDPTPDTQQYYSGGPAGPFFYWDLTTSKVDGALQVTWSEYQLVLNAVREYYAHHGVTPMVLTIYIQTDEKWNSCAKIVTHKDQRSDIPITTPVTLTTTQSTLSPLSNKTSSLLDESSVDLA